MSSRAVELRCLFSVVGAVEITLARFDRHHHPPEGLSVFAPKMERHCPGPVWPAALSVWAGSTVPALQLFQATATCVWQVNWMARFSSVTAFLTFLQERMYLGFSLNMDGFSASNEIITVYVHQHMVYLRGQLFAGTDFTDPSFFHQFALFVAVGQPRGHTRATGFGAGWPGCGLRHALDSSGKHVVHWITPESCADVFKQIFFKLKVG